MKTINGRTLMSGLVGLFLLLGVAAPLAFTSCDSQQPEINITMEADYSAIIAAINNANNQLGDKLSTIEKAMTDGLADSQAAMKLIQQAVESMSGTMEEKLAAIETAIKNQTTSLEMKLGLVEAAVNAGFADAKTQQDLLKEALESLKGTVEEKLAAVETAIKDQTTSFETKLGLVEAAVTTGLADVKTAQDLIKEAIETVGGTMEEKLAAIETAVKDQTTDLGAKLALVETAVKEGFADQKEQEGLLKEAIESLQGTVEEKLAALQEAMESQTSSLETKLDAIETAVETGIADAKEQRELIQKAVESLQGTEAEKLAKIEQAISSQTSTLSTKLAAIEAAIASGASDDATALEEIKTAIESSGNTTAEKLAALEQAITSQTTTLSTKLEAISTAVTTGLTNAVTALGLVKTAVEEVKTAVGDADTNLSAKIDDVVTALGDIETTLTTGDVATALANILAAVQGLTDYTDILTAIQNAIMQLVDALNGTINGYEYVDMGDGLLWATCNVGAENPWDSGGFFAWGETESKDTFTWANYKWMDPSINDWKGITKYTFADGATYTSWTAIWYNEDGEFIGDGAVSFADHDYEDDAARQNMGGTWRTPTSKEWLALANRDNYTREWITDYNGSGVDGMLVTRKNGPCAGNSIFLPAHGLRGMLSDHAGQGCYMYSLAGTTPRIVVFLTVPRGFGVLQTDRFLGVSVRAVSGGTTPPPIIAGHEYVDMGTVTIGGIERNLKWATCNVGAENPWDSGDYFAWGEREPKDTYTWATYKWMDPSINDWTGITRYTIADGKTGAIWYNEDGEFIGDGWKSLSFGYNAYDAASENWTSTTEDLPWTWRTPTDAEWTALRDDTLYDWVWTTNYEGSGVDGMLVTRKSGPCAGNSIFLPAAGLMINNLTNSAGSSGYYWSSSLYEGRSGCARNVCFFKSGEVLRDYVDRSYGFTVRPVSH